MPELPEVETVARQLNPVLCGQKLSRVRILDKARLKFSTRGLSSAVVNDVRRIGKLVVLSFESGSQLAIHLRMTGRLLWVASGIQPHTRVSFDFDEGRLLFVDVRRFGTVERLQADFEEQGVEPMSSEFTPKRLAQLLASSKQPLKHFLLRQDKIVGLGNIYASEILFAARISPERLTSEIEDNEVRVLHQKVRAILKRAIENCGTTFSDFQHTNGKIGSYQRFLKVYKREGEKCTICSAEIERMVQAQRSTFWCPNCQS